MTILESFRQPPEKNIPATLVAAFLLQTAGALFWAGSAADRIAGLERAVAADRAAVDQMAVVAEQVRAMAGVSGLVSKFSEAKKPRAG